MSSTHRHEQADIDIDLTDSELYRNGFPHELFVELRRMGSVLRHPSVAMARAPEGYAFWAVIGHPEVQDAGRTWETFSSIDGPRIVPTDAARRGQSLTNADAAAHTRLRKLVSSGFTPRMIAGLEEKIAQRTTQILDAVAARGECDLVKDVAYLLPMHMIADIVGMPDDDRAWVFSHTDRLMRSGDPTSGISQSERATIEAELFAYAQRLGEEKRRNPADDVWSLLATAEIHDAEAGTTRLSNLELDMFFLILSIAGSETTRNVLSQGLRRVDGPPRTTREASARGRGARHRGRRADPMDEPRDERSAARSPATWSSAGRSLSAGDRITLWFASANFDERAFDDPFEFDLDRSPNRHVAFGAGGPHFCLGAHLARREIRTMFEQLVSRFDVIERPREPTWLATGPDSSVAVSLDRIPRVRSVQPPGVG